MKKICFTLFLIIVYINSVHAEGKPFMEDEEEHIETFCAKEYANLYFCFAAAQNFDFYERWSSYKDVCQSTGEYDLYLATFMKEYGRDKNKAKELLIELLNNKHLPKDLEIKIKKRANVALSFILEEQGKLDELITLAEKNIKEYPGWARPYLFIANAKIYQEKYKEAELYANKAISLNKELTGPYLALTLVSHFEYEDPIRALKYYKLAIDRGNYYWVFQSGNATRSAVLAAMNQKNYKLVKWILDKQEQFYPESKTRDWYIELKSNVYAYFKENKIDPETIFSEEEKEGLASRKIGILDIIGKD